METHIQETATEIPELLRARQKKIDNEEDTETMTRYITDIEILRK